MSPTKFSVLFLILTSNHFYWVEGQSSTKTSPNYISESVVTHGKLETPRGIAQDESGDILVVARGTSNVHAIYQEGDQVKTAVIIEGADLNLNHGIAYQNGYLYASNSSMVLRWGYASGRREKVTTEPEVVVRGIPSGGDHFTRTIIIDGSNHLYVTVGSAANVDQDSSRARIKRFNLAGGFQDGGFDFESNGELFVDGVRNTVGLAIDGSNNLWGVDCGAEELVREDLGGDIHNTNPADKLIKFTRNAFYGYPYCWTVDQLAGHPRAQQMAWPSFMEDGTHTDAWCQNTNYNRPPTLALPAHNAPLGLTFYDGAGCDTSTDSFPCTMKGDIFVSFHGSWNREPPAGYKVVRIPVDSNTHVPTGEIQDIIYETDVNSCVTQASKCFRPVDLVFDRKGHLIVTSDTSNELIRVKYRISKDDDSKPEDRRIAVSAIIAVAIIALFTGIVIGMIARRYCCFCCPAKEIPYQREDI